ncbi:hypothetical protein GTO89_15605 [Heliobacterium gestii]|uniref:SLH domain-containing protein n=1 Tax=Heliomicrobium gestii TaxID=2699 RepID=A0A845LE52_HELGE|nr:S-layer homology domain-containing protein [Heliomicrobium gestii]MBM7868265.1 hypothetical protein [Heliomicrobium gestii]MZP44458.1 hypothetical protein [Heliomicrobium gestii]
MRKGIVCACLALSIVTSPAVSLAAVTQFGDVSAAMPEYRPIMKLSAQGTIKGRGDGNFGPSDPVKQLEALVMVQRFFGLEATANASASQLTPDIEKKFGGNVPAWGKGYLVTAVNQGLLDANETFPWDQGASRAWVSRLLVRLLGKEQEAQSRMSSSLTFSDASQIPAWARGHISIATDLGLIRGRDGGYFDPNTVVTRGEMAIFLDRVEGRMDRLPPGIYEASFISAQDSTLSVLGDGNLLSSLTLDTGARLFNKDRAVAATDLSPQAKIRYIKDGDKVTYLEVSQDSGLSANVAKGEIIASLPDQGLVTVKDDSGKPHTYPLAAGVKVLTLTGQQMTANALSPGCKVQLRLNNEGKVSEALLESAAQQSLQGAIVDLNKTNNILVLSNSANQYSTYYLDANVAVEYKGRRFTSLDDLHKGDSVSVDVDGSYVVTKITVLQAQSNVTVKGVVSLINKDSRLFTVKGDDGQLYAYELPDSASIQLANGTSARFDEVFQQDPVTVYLTDGKIAKLVIERSGSTRGIWGKIASVDTSRRLMIVKDQQDRLSSYEIKDPVILDIEDDDNPALGDLKVDDIIQFELDRDEKVTYIKKNDTLEGTVTRNDADRHLLTLRDDLGTEKVYTVANNVDVEIYNRSSEDLEDVDDDDLVKIKVENDKVTQIKVHRIANGEVTEISNSSDRFDMEDSDGDEHSYHIGSDVKLVIPGITKPKVSDLSIGQWVQIAYWGDEPYEVTLQTPVMGEITDLDRSHETLTVRQYDGTTNSYKLASGFKADKGGETSSSISTFSIGDRIQSTLDVKGNIFRATVAKKVSGAVDGINRSTKEIYIGTTVGYLITPNTYILQNGVRKQFDDIDHKQNVSIYYLPGYKALEVTLPSK